MFQRYRGEKEAKKQPDHGDVVVSLFLKNTFLFLFLQFHQYWWIRTVTPLFVGWCSFARILPSLGHWSREWVHAVLPSSCACCGQSTSTRTCYYLLFYHRWSSWTVLVFCRKVCLFFNGINWYEKQHGAFGKIMKNWDDGDFWMEVYNYEFIFTIQF